MTAVAGDAAVLDMTDPRARDPAVTGAKAANLARAAAAGLPVLPGFVLATGANPDEAGPSLHAAWERLAGPERPLVVRSSSTVEDLAMSSMAGRFVSVVGVRGWDAFEVAVDRVLASGSEPGSMAVLVQTELPASRGGVLFGMDPITGSRRRFLVEAVGEAPQQLVAGSVTGSRYLLSRAGRILEGDRGDQALVDVSLGRRLGRLAQRTGRVFGAPQDVEWAEDGHQQLWLLQSRPVTAAAAPSPAVGPLLGPGPVAETFPHQVRPLERELWVAPLRAGIVEALGVAGAAPPRRILDSPVVVVVDGWVAVDLELLGYATAAQPWWRRLDPRGPLGHLVASWRVGRLRVALPDLVQELVADTDVALHEVPPLGSLTERELVQVLQRTRHGLVALHAYEVLAGMLLDAAPTGPSAAALGLRALAAGRARGDRDDAIVAADPTVLTLWAPRIGVTGPLPAVGEALGPGGVTGPESLFPREALRLRIRWVQELGARAAAELARRWSTILRHTEAVALLSMQELEDVADGGALPDRVMERRPSADAPPLPAQFRLTATGDVTASRTEGDGRAAGGGRAIGTVRHDDHLDDLLPGDVLIVRALSPELSVHLGHLAALVAETGSVLSHMAILAREAGVPTVVAVPDACARFPSGTTVLVDGTAGTVEHVGGRS